MKILDPGNETLDYQNMKKIFRHRIRLMFIHLTVKNLILLYFIHILQIQKMPLTNTLRIFPTLNLCVSFSLTVSQLEVGRA